MCAKLRIFVWPFKNPVNNLMLLPFEPYRADWNERFRIVSRELADLLHPVNPVIEHIGSTSVAGLSAKPVIDVLVGLQSAEDLDKVPVLLAGNRYTYYEKYNDDMPYRRFFIRFRERPEHYGFPQLVTHGTPVPALVHDHAFREAHIHVIPVASEHWERHMAFRDYLRTHAAVKQAYQQLKEVLVQKEWEDGNDYNRAKDAFIKQEERRAVAWYRAKNNFTN